MLTHLLASDCSQIEIIHLALWCLTSSETSSWRLQRNNFTVWVRMRCESTV